MTLSMETEAVPLSFDPDGVVGVRSTRVTLDSIITAFRQGPTPEGIVEQFPSLNLADVYQVIGY